MFAKRQESNEKLSSSEASNNEIEEDDVFSAGIQPKASSSCQKSMKVIAQNLVQNWLDSSSKDVSADGAFLGEQ